MTILGSFGRRKIVGCVSSVAMAAGMVAAIGIATPTLGADLYTEPAPQSYEYRPYPPPAAYPPPAYGQPRYVPERYVPGPYGYRPYGPAYRPYVWADPNYAYRGRYAEAYPRPPAPIVGPPRPWTADPREYDEGYVQAAPPPYGYPVQPAPRW
jgi:hypothetical protein